MSCYFRHLQDIFKESGIEVTAANRKAIDRAIHRIVNISYKNCPATWKEIKSGIADPQKREEFIRKLRNTISD